MKSKGWFFLFLMIICFSAGYRIPNLATIPANKAGQDYFKEPGSAQANSREVSSKSEMINEQLPAFYDGRKEGRVPSVKNQGSIGTCWAFASLQALEAALLPGGSYEFSEDHMSLNNGFCIPQEEGGEYTMSMAYLLSWRGPVLESDDPYGDGISPDGLNAVKHVQEIQILPDKDFEKIKQAVLMYGGVQSSLYTSLAEGDFRSESYNQEAYAYCYTGTEPPNHDSVIIGWDDAYPKENFHGEVQGDGAFICMNSWGDGFGDQGYFYVSYYDSNIGRNNIVYTAVEDTDNYDHIYQSDLRGWVGQLGYGEDTMWFSNVYESGTSQSLLAAGFYATGPHTSYEVYIVRHAGTESDILEGQDFDRKVLLSRGSFDYGGYYTVPLMGNHGEDLELSPGERFAVIVKITTPDAVHPAAIEYDAGDGRTFVNVADGEGYISADGITWERAEEKRCNLCLKAYTKDR